MLADDIALTSNNIYSLHELLDLDLSEDYFKNNYVSLSSEKTKLMAYSNSCTKYQVYYDKLVSPISIDKKKVEFTEEAEHVGIKRSTQPAGNLAHILNRFTSHQKAIAAVAPTGLGKRRRANPAL